MSDLGFDSSPRGGTNLKTYVKSSEHVVRAGRCGLGSPVPRVRRVFNVGRARFRCVHPTGIFGGGQLVTLVRVRRARNDPSPSVILESNPPGGVYEASEGDCVEAHVEGIVGVERFDMVLAVEHWLNLTHAACMQLSFLRIGQCRNGFATRIKATKEPLVATAIEFEGQPCDHCCIAARRCIVILLLPMPEEPMSSW